MPYVYEAGIAVGPDARDDLFQKLRAAMLSVGWTEHDILSDVVNNRRIVMKGAEITPGIDNAPYIMLWESTNTTRFFLLGYQDWDPVTHVGIKETGGTAQCFVDIQMTNFAYFFRVNQVAIAFMTKIGTIRNKGYAGFIRRALPAHKTGVVKSSAAVATGVVTIPTTQDPRTGMIVGQQVHVLNFAHNNASANKDNAELLTIASMTANSITFTTTLSKAFDAGALIGLRPAPLVVMNTQGALVASSSAYIPHDDTGFRTGTGVSHSWAGQAQLYASVAALGPIREFWAGPIYYYSNLANLNTPVIGTLYHYASISMPNVGNATLEDVFDDGAGSTFLVVATSSYQSDVMGPR